MFVCVCGPLDCTQIRFVIKSVYGKFCCDHLPSSDRAKGENNCDAEGSKMIVLELETQMKKVVPVIIFEGKAIVFLEEDSCVFI